MFFPFLEEWLLIFEKSEAKPFSSHGSVAPLFHFKVVGWGILWVWGLQGARDAAWVGRVEAGQSPSSALSRDRSRAVGGSFHTLPRTEVGNGWQPGPQDSFELGTLHSVSGP